MDDLEEVDGLLAPLVARFGDALGGAPTSQEVADESAQENADLVDPLVVFMLKRLQRVWGRRRVLDDAARVFGDPESFRMSLGWMMLISRMRFAQRLTAIAADGAREIGARKRAVDQLTAMGDRKSVV